MTSAANDAVQWLVTDHLGTPRLVADLSGSLSGLTRHDYLPFGEEVGAGVGGRTSAQGYVEDKVRQGFTGYEHDRETGLEFAQARYYASVQGRFTSVDPLAASARPVEPQTWNRYSYSYNNPLRFTDPSGMIAGDFYNEAGDYLGTDGINDGNIYIVPNKNEARQIKQTNENKQHTPLSSVPSAVVSPDRSVRQAIGAAVDRSNKPTADDKYGGFHEEAVTWGNGQIIANAPGALAVKDVATADITVAANPAEQSKLDALFAGGQVEGSAHVHPKGGQYPPSASGSVMSASPIISYNQPPSPKDKQNANFSTNIVAAAGENRVYFYNKSGIIIAKFPLDKFRKL